MNHKPTSLRQIRNDLLKMGHTFDVPDFQTAPRPPTPTTFVHDEDNLSSQSSPVDVSNKVASDMLESIIKWAEKNPLWALLILLLVGSSMGSTPANATAIDTGQTIRVFDAVFKGLMLTAFTVVGVIFGLPPLAQAVRTSFKKRDDYRLNGFGLRYKLELPLPSLEPYKSGNGTLPGAVAVVKSAVTVASASLQCTRIRNEDATVIAQRMKKTLVGIADGLGGEPNGTEASAAVVSGLEYAFLAAPNGADTTMECMLRLFQGASISLESVARTQNPGKDIGAIEGFKTTLIAAVIDEATGLCCYGYCGDGLLLHLRAEDSVVVPLAAPSHDENGHLTASLSPAGIMGRVSRGQIQLQLGDSLLVASDGIEVGDPKAISSFLLERLRQRNAATPSQALHAALQEMSEECADDGRPYMQDNCSAVLLQMEV